MPFMKTDEKPASSRAELLDEFDVLLAKHQLDSKITKRYLGRIRLPRLIGGIGGAAMCLLALFLVLLPPPSHDHGLRYIGAAAMLVCGAYVAVKFAL